ncbi:potassium channel family protein [Uliginosibacterium sp. H3]|uniref:Potassium channel family protein n=1 Tax=Uliginosibacterium silvisoli TaxID=3114758 RepID=A0ABU6K2Z3_9RHOO|nr:potassium channel family protein [Uliginosibacterium sp. H3]
MRKSTPPQRNRLFMKSSRTPEQLLLARCILLLALVGAILVIFWVDREGLRDQIDGHVSFGDVAYFTAVTVTTVGYGDIVPVSPRARMIDTLLVTPLRLVIWLVFLGTAYELVLQRWWENRRMKQLHARLDKHLIVCGYGHGGQAAAHEAIERGMPANQIIVLDRDPARLALAADAGCIGLAGDSTREQDLNDAGVARAKAVMICLGRDDAAVLTVLTVRQLSPQVRIVCSVNEEENIKLIEQAGANATVAPSMIGGYLMTNFVDSSHAADYVNDLMRIGGRVRLIERAPEPGEIGKPMRDISPAMAVRLHRGTEVIGFWEGERGIIRAGDTLLVIAPNL